MRLLFSISYKDPNILDLHRPRVFGEKYDKRKRKRRDEIKENGKIRGRRELKK
jgi:hypothetical protein